MELEHPIDRELRDRLRAFDDHTQADFAKKIGRRRPWFNKWIHGAGHATVDDVIRMLAVLIGLESKPLTAQEQQLLKAFGQLESDDREDVMEYAQMRAKRARNGQSKESSAPAAHTPRATVRKARGTR